MAFEAQIREIIRTEIDAAITPLAREVAELQRGSDLTAKLRAALGGASPKAARRGPGRPRAGSGRKAGVGSTHACAVIGCKRPSRSKGYCAAHYQKRRNLAKTKRLPSDRKENAAPGTVMDLVLPRGRAGAKALAEARE